MNQKLTLSLLGLTLAVVATLAIAPIVNEMAYATQIARGGNGGIGGAGGAGGVAGNNGVLGGGGNGVGNNEVEHAGGHNHQGVNGVTMAAMVDPN